MHYSPLTMWKSSLEAESEGHMTPGSSGNGADADQGKLRKNMMRFFSLLRSHYGTFEAR